MYERCLTHYRSVVRAQDAALSVDDVGAAVANFVTASMMMLSPTTVSMPFKLLLFVLIDGWVKLTHGLILTYV